MKKILLTLLLPASLMHGAGNDGKFITKPNIDWFNPSDVKEYINENYPKHNRSLIKLINMESGFRPYVKNTNSSAIGFTQITKRCAEDVGFTYKLVKENPMVNIHAGYLYFVKCMEKAGHDFDKAYEYYNKGLYFDIKGE